MAVAGHGNGNADCDDGDGDGDAQEPLAGDLYPSTKYVPTPSTQHAQPLQCFLFESSLPTRYSTRRPPLPLLLRSPIPPGLPRCCSADGSVQQE